MGLLRPILIDLVARFNTVAETIPAVCCQEPPQFLTQIQRPTHFGAAMPVF